MRQTVAEHEADLRRQPVAYHENGTVRLPVTYSQLLKECERLKSELDIMKAFHTDTELYYYLLRQRRMREEAIGE